MIDLDSIVNDNTKKKKTMKSGLIYQIIPTEF